MVTKQSFLLYSLSEQNPGNYNTLTLKSKLIQFRKCLVLFSAEAKDLPLHVQKHSSYNPQKCIVVALLGYETLTGGNM
jgi:hypothetical protein